MEPVGVDDEIERLWVDERDGLVRACTLICGSPTDAADAVDEAFVNTLSRYRRARIDNLLGYWWRAAMNEVVRTRRRGRRRRELERLGHMREVRVEPPESAVVDAAMAAWAALRPLDATSRAVLVLRFYSDLSVADVAAHLDRSEGAVKTITRRALAQLQADAEDATGPNIAGGSHARPD